MIIEWPLLWQFNDARDVILTSWTDVREMGDDDDDDDDDYVVKMLTSTDVR